MADRRVDAGPSGARASGPLRCSSERPCSPVAERAASIGRPTRPTYRAASPQARRLAIVSEVLLIALLALALIYLPSQVIRAPESPKALMVRLLASPSKPPTPLPSRAEAPPPRIMHPVFVPVPAFEIAAPVNSITRVTHQPPAVFVPAIRAPEVQQPSVDVLIAYQVLLRAAVQRAILYPIAAKAAGIQGNSRVAFDFRDGRVSNFEILQTSGSQIIDRAAIAAIASAVIPTPPVEINGRQFRFALVVTFSLGNG